MPFEVLDIVGVPPGLIAAHFIKDESFLPPVVGVQSQGDADDGACLAEAKAGLDAEPTTSPLPRRSNFFETASRSVVWDGGGMSMPLYCELGLGRYC